MSERRKQLVAACLATVAIVAVAAPRSAAAQDQTDFQVWTALIGSADLEAAPPGIALWLDVHARRGDANTVHILRPGVGYRLSPLLSLWAGYAWVPVFADQGDTFHEHRVWQQAILQHQTSSGVNLQSRTRLEQRFGDGGSDVGLRIRQFARAGWKPWNDLPVGGVIWDEVFLGLNETDWDAPRGFDQNRLFLGLSLAMPTSARFEAGYMFVNVDRATDLFAHVLAVNLFVGLHP